MCVKGINFVLVSTIFLLDAGTILMEWYFFSPYLIPKYCSYKLLVLRIARMILLI